MDETAKILVIEDDKFLNKLYSDQLRREGFEVSVAISGEEGLSKALNENPDLVILDIMLPKMDGFAVLIELKKDNATKKIPVLMMTNLGQQADIDKGKQLGADDYIVKSSLTPSQVSEKIKAFLK